MTKRKEFLLGVGISALIAGAILILALTREEKPLPLPLGSQLTLVYEDSFGRYCRTGQGVYYAYLNLGIEAPMALSSFKHRFPKLKVKSITSYKASPYWILIIDTEYKRQTTE